MSIWKVARTLTIEGAVPGTQACVIFRRFYKDDWGYMGMRDYRTEEPTDQFYLAAAHYDENKRVNDYFAGSTPGTFKSIEIDKSTANKIWYNIEKRQMNYNQLRDALKKEGLLVSR